MPEGLTMDKTRGEKRGAADLIRREFGEFIAPGYVQEGINHFPEYRKPDNFAKRSSGGNHLALTAKIGGKIIGVIEICDRNHIRLFFVDREHHSNGIGRGLLREATGLCEGNGSKGIDVDSSTSRCRSTRDRILSGPVPSRSITAYASPR